LLVVGNSHYGTPDDYRPDFTTSVIESYPDVYGRAFFTKTAQVISDAPSWTVDVVGVFSTIAFYNFAQEFAATGARVRPVDAKMPTWLPAFWEVTEVFAPAHVLVLGTQVWMTLPDGEEHHELQVNGEARDAIRYRAGTNTFWATSIRHPAAAFSYSRWAPWVVALRRL
jgi:hypothetical protein